MYLQIPLSLLWMIMRGLVKSHGSNQDHGKKMVIIYLNAQCNC